MAILTFELLARRFIYNRGADYSQRRLLFEAGRLELHFKGCAHGR